MSCPSLSCGKGPSRNSKSWRPWTTFKHFLPRLARLVPTATVPAHRPSSLPLEEPFPHGVQAGIRGWKEQGGLWAQGELGAPSLALLQASGVVPPSNTQLPKPCQDPSSVEPMSTGLLPAAIYRV